MGRTKKNKGSNLDWIGMDGTASATNEASTNVEQPKLNDESSTQKEEDTNDETKPPFDGNYLLGISTKITALQEKINDCQRRSVEHAREIGKLVSEQQATLTPKVYQEWIATLSTSISASTIERYLDLFIYELEIGIVDNFTDAYEKIREIRKQKKEEHERDSFRRIEQFERTGVKPTDWTRSDDYQKGKNNKSPTLHNVQLSSSCSPSVNERPRSSSSDNIIKPKPPMERVAEFIQSLEDLLNAEEKLSLYDSTIQYCTGRKAELAETKKSHDKEAA